MVDFRLVMEGIIIMGMDSLGVFRILIMGILDIHFHTIIISPIIRHIMVENMGMGMGMDMDLHRRRQIGDHCSGLQCFL